MEHPHTQEKHLKNVDSICRLCLNLVKSSKTGRTIKANYDVSEHQPLIYVIYGLDVNSDVKGTHSRFICKNCKRKLEVDVARNNVKQYESARAQMWIAYNGDVYNECQTCQHLKNLKAGRKYKLPKEETQPTAPVSIHALIKGS